MDIDQIKEDIRAMHEKVTRNESTIEYFKEVRCTYKEDLEILQKQLRKHLNNFKIVDNSFSRTPYEEESLRITQDNNSRWDERLSIARNIEPNNRKAKIEISLDNNNERFIICIYRDGKEFDKFKVRLSDLYGAKRPIDEHIKRVRVPWKTIKSGQAWSEKIHLSPYYLADIPIDNIIEFKNKEN